MRCHLRTSFPAASGFKGIYAPLAFSAVLDGAVTPPASIRVEFHQGPIKDDDTGIDRDIRVALDRLEYVDMDAASDLDAACKTYLFPYPVDLTEHIVTLHWRQRIQEGEYEPRNRPLGPLCEAVKRLRTNLGNMANGPLPGNARPKKPATDEYRGMPGLERALLASVVSAGAAYAWPNVQRRRVGCQSILWAGRHLSVGD